MNKKSFFFPLSFLMIEREQVNKRTNEQDRFINICLGPMFLAAGSNFL